jgi:hypothetical protein
VRRSWKSGWLFVENRPDFAKRENATKSAKKARFRSQNPRFLACFEASCGGYGNDPSGIMRLAGGGKLWINRPGGIEPPSRSAANSHTVAAGGWAHAEHAISL